MEEEEEEEEEEAAGEGGELPSEKARHEETTCVSGSLIVGHRFRAGEGGEGLARLDLSRTWARS